MCLPTPTRHAHHEGCRGNSGRWQVSHQCWNGHLKEWCKAELAEQSRAEITRILMNGEKTTVIYCIMIASGDDCHSSPDSLQSAAEEWQQDCDSKQNFLKDGFVNFTFSISPLPLFSLSSYLLSFFLFPLLLLYLLLLKLQLFALLLLPP